VYRWEARYGAHGDVFGRIDGMDRIAEWVDRVWAAEAPRYRRDIDPAPQVAVPRSNQRRATANHRTCAISIPQTMRTRWVILHEVAHYLAGPWARHGGIFVGVLIGLLARHLSLPLEDLIASAARHRVSVNLRAVVGPPWAAWTAASATLHATFNRACEGMLPRS
jgi:hypothetical protein